MSNDATTLPIPDDASDITLRDVIVHMQHGFSRLDRRITDLDDRLTGRMDSLEGRMDRLEGKMDSMEERLTARIDALEEDLTATMRDTSRIREHVGMGVEGE